MRVRIRFPTIRLMLLVVACLSAQAMAHAAADADDTKSIRRLVSELGKDGDRSRAAKSELIQLGPAGVPALEKELGRGKKSRRRDVLEILCRIAEKTPQTVSSLSRAIGDSNLREPAVRWLHENHYCRCPGQACPVGEHTVALVLPLLEVIKKKGAGWERAQCALLDFGSHSTNTLFDLLVGGNAKDRELARFGYDLSSISFRQGNLIIRSRRGSIRPPTDALLQLGGLFDQENPQTRKHAVSCADILFGSYVRRVRPILVFLDRAATDADAGVREQAVVMAGKLVSAIREIHVRSVRKGEAYDPISHALGMRILRRAEKDPSRPVKEAAAKRLEQIDVALRGTRARLAAGSVNSAKGMHRIRYRDDGFRHYLEAFRRGPESVYAQVEYARALTVYGLNQEAFTTVTRSLAWTEEKKDRESLLAVRDQAWMLWQAQLTAPRLPCLLVHSLMKGHQAKKLGVRPGDIVLSVEGNDVKSLEEFAEQWKRVPPGKKATITIWRSGALKTVRPKAAKNFGVYLLTVVPHDPNVEQYTPR